MVPNKHTALIQETAVCVLWVTFHFHFTISCVFVSRVHNVKSHLHYTNVVILSPTMFFSLTKL